MSGNIYRDVVKVFYTNLHIDGENLCSHVKGIDMEITPDVWTALTGLKYAGLRINHGNIGVVEEFNKMQYYNFIFIIKIIKYNYLLIHNMCSN